jgi:hypothetical protein
MSTNSGPQPDIMVIRKHERYQFDRSKARISWNQADIKEVVEIFCSEWNNCEVSFSMMKPTDLHEHHMGTGGSTTE